ncbi:MAG: DUF4127 family protein [Bacilli bacterium]|nr:DUF4127 family protein [Bacilli bacterium]
MKITVIPLDSRPCNTVWLSDLAAIARLTVTIYPRELCGTLLAGANFDQMMTWLDKEVVDSDYLIISADGLCSGGLVQARLGLINHEEIMAKLQVFRSYKQANPRLKIYVFDTIMRTTITTLSKETDKYWGLMNEYSRLVGRCHFFSDKDEAKRLEEVKKIIPNEIIETYHRGRRKKHELNKFFLQLTKEQVVDYMILLQEDSMPYGVQKIEQEILQSIINENKLDDVVKFYNGTDEGGVVLLGKIILETIHKKPKLYVHLPYKNALNKVMLFEDQLFSYNLHHMMDTLGFEACSDETKSDFILSIYVEERNENLDTNSIKPIIPLKNEIYYHYVKELNQFLSGNKPVAFVDLLFPNGGSIDLLQDVCFHKLQVYSAWNTASNAMGSALCEIAAKTANPHHHSLKFRNERFLDDCLYQYVVRRIVNEKYVQQDVNVYNLGEHSEEVLQEIIKLMHQYDGFLGKHRYRVSLPWKRTFEAEIEIEESYGI